MIGNGGRGVEEREPVGEHVRASLLVGIAVGLLKISEGDPLLGEVVVILLAGGNLMMKISNSGILVVVEGCGGEASLFLFHDLESESAFL